MPAGQWREEVIVFAREKVNPVDPGRPVVFAEEVGEPVVGQEAGLRIL